ncbi:S49 family peptidase [Legionella quateirensis]|uniref:Signal peptide peptidase n=1 Tax=Legionella quateirensis TaxID=45072 RepID=A0A378KVK7_9GAMM|nr:S49 family peptidase [Legionella quateirensis]KTD51145.1 signal peptide peptidase [Legionella quateirensis]STY17611.1 signal peptide peptidase [Legionella quateirensis]
MNNDLTDSNVDSQTLLNQIVLDYMKEKKRKRRWRWISRTLFVLIIAYIGYKIVSYSSDSTGTNIKAHVGLIDLNGEIFDSKNVNSDNFAKGMQSAYKNKGLKALILRINSPGGSPVQAEYMYNTIKYYQARYPNIKIYSVCVDMCASAAYYIAVGADSIYASPSSLVGSIGVLYNGFGFVDGMEKIGVTRRLVTSGSNKGFLDPFSPITDTQKQKLQTMLDIIHQQFINRVKEGRGSRLHIDEDTFSGLFWTGEQALANGLIDGYGSSGQVAREIIKIDNIIDYTQKQNLFERVTQNIGTAMADELPLSFGIKPGFK